jgi:predicted nucleic acid-binding protein
MAGGWKATFQESQVLAPDHLLLESANALRKYVRAGEFDEIEAAGALADVLALRIDFVPAAPLASGALRLSLQLGLSVYDTAYVMVAEAAKATLVTADRRLAAAYERSELIS